MELLRFLLALEALRLPLVFVLAILFVERTFLVRRLRRLAVLLKI